MSVAKAAAVSTLSALLCACGQATLISASSVVVDPSFDTAAIQTAVDKGGIVTFAPGSYLITSTIIVRKSGTTIRGSGNATSITFKPILPQTDCVNDRAFTTPCDVITTRRRQIAAAVSIGDSSFTVVDDVSDLRNGDWLIIDEDDAQLGGVPINVDWAQVSAVAGNKVSVSTPFRSSFSTSRPFSDSNRTGLGFYKIPQLIENVTFKDFSIFVPDSGEGAPGISVFAAKDTIVDNVSVRDENGQALYSYLSKGLTITNSSGDSGKLLNEFGATVDLTLANDAFTSQQTTALGLDLGCAFFDISRISIPSSTNVGAYIILGAHDGQLSNSDIAFVASPGNAVGILLRGTQRITIVDNSLAGGAGASIGISVGPQTQSVDIPIASSGNVVTPNYFGSQWSLDYD